MNTSTVLFAPVRIFLLFSWQSRLEGSGWIEESIIGDATLMKGVH